MKSSGQIRLPTGRPGLSEPTEPERRLSLAFLQENSLKEFALALFNLNEFVYVD